ncbi:MAG: TIGR03905 family TSCPD domain-containing protein [Lachnospiraceae bacterium]|nr:TIGR03905 family TSCPD domain-containing protein [Lachnospiraceae bacterium]MDE6759795.1 TIGR03905 family TSCPD domain-containing protein [Lachnospiraceae bacterium]
MTFKPQGVCAQKIDFDIVDGRLTNVQFFGGCNGNTQGVSRLLEGMEVNEAISRLEGIQCGFKGTSCPDQLAKALKQASADI